MAPAIEHEHWLGQGRKQGGDGGPFHPIVQAQQDGGRGEDGTGVAGGHERVGAAGLLKAETDDDTGIGFLADGGEGLLGHADDLGRIVKL